MKPHFTTSPRPATSSARGSPRSVERSQSTPAGSWKEPTRFLPVRVLMPVLPPTAASTIPSRVVGTCTTRTPRSHVAATKPPTSVVAPPPKVTTTSERVKPASPSASQHDTATAAFLARSPSGIGSTMTSYAAASESSTGRTSSARASENTTATRCTPTPSTCGSRSARSCPITTSYGVWPSTCSTVSFFFFISPPSRPIPGQCRIDLPGDILGGATVRVHDDRCHRLVDRGALVEQRLDLAPDVAEQQRSRRTQPHALHGVGQPDPQEDDLVADQELAGAGVEHRSPAQRQDAVVGGQRRGDRLALQAPELGLAGVHEDVGDRAALGRLDVLVGVADGDVPGLGQEPGDRGLAGPHRADQHDAWAHLNLSVSR